MNVLMSPERASKLLDELIYSRVRECIDFEALLTVELDLWVALCEQHDFSADSQARREAKAMIDRALGRLGTDDERYAPIGWCADCDDEKARAPVQPRQRSS